MNFSDAVRKLSSNELDVFLGHGLFMGLSGDRVLVAWGPHKKSSEPHLNINSNKSTDQLQFYIPDFFLTDKKPWAAFENVAIVDRESMGQELENLAQGPHLDLVLREPSREDFKNKFNSVQKSIRSGQLGKAVPVVVARSETSVTKSMRAKYIRNILQRAKAVTPYGYLTPSEGIIGATPETLFSVEPSEAEIKTMALAGTRATALEKQQPLLTDRKEVFEHELVIRGLKAQLSSFGQVEQSKTYVWDLGLISHLRTDMSIKLNSKDFASGDVDKTVTLFSELISRMHPTPALGVSPVTADWRLLKEVDGQDERMRFGAPFGVVQSGGSMQALVAIRNLQWSDGQAFLCSGCGVVEQSDFESEWNELKLKRKSVCGLLGI